MSIDKALSRAPRGNRDKKVELEIEIEPSISENDDGSVTIDLSGEPPPKKGKKGRPEPQHGDNLVDFLKEDVVTKLGGDLLTDVDADKASRADWERTLTDGMRLLGLKIEERSEPWAGACGVVHPVLTEAVVRFQSEMMTETFPAAGPVKTRLKGRETKEKTEAADRVREDMNLELTQRMSEYRREHERLLWNLPIAGTALKKIYFDPALKRQCSMFVAAEDFIVAHGTTDLRTCPRYAQRMRVTKMDLLRSIGSGMYADIAQDGVLPDPVPDGVDDVQDAKEKLSGQSINMAKATHYTIYEVCVEMEIDGLNDGYAPYVVTILKDTQQVLSIRRNWGEEAATKEKIQYFIDYHYVPGFGFYSFGLIHLVGGFAEGATSLLRQLVDAGTLSNLPGGLKTRGLRVKNETDPIGPGEWRDVDVPSGMLKENLMPLPYKEPSAVLAQLLDVIVEEGRKLAAVAEMKIADFDSNSPVGTTMALLERTLKVMTAIQSRIYESMKHEFALIKSLVEEHGAPAYDYEPETGTADMRKADYASVEILPVADPNAATMSQRIVQWQAVMQLIQMAPQIYDMPKVHGRMLKVLNVNEPDELIPALKAQSAPRDPVTENMALLQMQPVKAFPMQDHQSHIAVHMAAMQDPMIQQMVGQSPQAQTISAAAYAHVVEHLSFEYRNQVEKMMGVQLPAPDQPLPPEIEYQLSGLIAQAAQKLLGQNQAFMQQMAQQAQQQDPLAQQAMMDAQVKKAEVDRKAARDQAEMFLKKRELDLKERKEGGDMAVDKAKLTLEEKKLTGEQTMAAMQEVIAMLQSKEEMSHDMRMRAADHLSQVQHAQMSHAQQMQAGERDRQHQTAMADRQHMQGLQAGEVQHQRGMQQTQAQQQHEIGLKAGEQSFQEEQSLQQRAHDSNSKAADREHQSTMAQQNMQAKEKAQKAKPAAKKTSKPKK